MILRIYQAPRTTFPGLPDDASAFVGSHTGSVICLAGTTFERYGRTWIINRIQSPGPGQWTFSLAATPQSEIGNPQSAIP